MSTMPYGRVSIGDPVEVQFTTVLNLRGDTHRTWIPATVIYTDPCVAVAFADSSRLALDDEHPYRIPEWARAQRRSA